MTVNIKVKPEASIQDVLGYISQIARVPSNFINIYFEKKKLSNTELIFRTGLVDGAQLICIEGQGDLRSFSRYKNVSSSGWCFSANSWDAITWKPNRTIMVAGFGIYGIVSGQSQFVCKYKYLINSEPSDEMEQEVMTAEIDPQTRIYPLMFDDDLVEIPAETTFTVCMRFQVGSN